MGWSTSSINDDPEDDKTDHSDDFNTCEVNLSFAYISFSLLVFISPDGLKHRTIVFCAEGIQC